MLKGLFREGTIVENNVKDKQRNKQRKEKTWIAEKLWNISRVNEMMKWQKSRINRRRSKTKKRNGTKRLRVKKKKRKYDHWVETKWEVRETRPPPWTEAHVIGSSVRSASSLGPLSFALLPRTKASMRRARVAGDDSQWTTGRRKMTDSFIFSFPSSFARNLTLR